MCEELYPTDKKPSKETWLDNIANINTLPPNLKNWVLHATIDFEDMYEIENDGSIFDIGINQYVNPEQIESEYRHYANSDY